MDVSGNGQAIRSGMNRSALIIRADAGPSTGLGHVMRCIALAQQWRDRFGPVTIASRPLPKAVARRLHRERLQRVTIRPPTGSAADAAALLKVAVEQHAAAIVLDGYQFGPEYQRLVHASPFTCLVIDDYLHQPEYYADLLLNQNTAADQNEYEKRAPAAECLLGPRFALLRKELLAPSSSPAARTTDEIRLLVTLGGFDPGGVTQMVIDAIEMLSMPCHLRVRLLSGLPDLQIRDSRIDLVPFASDMAKLYRWADLAICAGGSTNWEMCRFGIPRLVLVLADNQRGIAKSLHQAGCCVNAGWHESSSPTQVRDMLAALLAADLAPIRLANRQLVDGEGAGRVAGRIMAVSRQRAVAGQRRESDQPHGLVEQAASDSNSCR
jgi:UDP-2,4-diacetamido-2,4,6-trideoxy-beta-L-altropyranose hydrolase